MNRFAIALGILLLTARPAYAQVVSLTVDSAIQRALENNPELQAVRMRIAVAEANRKWAGRLDDPALEASGTTDQFGLDDGEGVLELAIEQRFPLTRRLAREREVSDWDLALAKAEVAVREWQLAGEVQEAALLVLGIHSKIELRERIREVRGDLARNLQRYFERGEASQLDVTEADLEIQAQVKEIGRLRAEEEVLSGALRGLVGLPPATRILMSGALRSPAQVEEISEQQVLSQRPDLLLRILQERRAEAAIALAATRRWQDVAVRFLLEREASEDAPEGLERNTFLGAGISIPIPLRTPAARMTDAPTRELVAAQASSEALRMAIRNEVATARDALARRREIWLQASGQSLTLARRNVEEVRQAWQTGKESFTRLQLAQERQLAIEEEAIESLQAYHLAKARLDRATGYFRRP